MFIVFEGIDKSGKSTQCQLLYEYFENCEKPAMLLKYPDRNSPMTGPIINDYLTGKIELSPNAASILLAANLWELKDKILQQLQIGTTIIIDRYTWSNIAYSVARGMNQQTCEIINSGLPIPNFIIFMDVDPLTASKRSGFGKEIFEKLEFQQSVYKIMCSLTQTSPNIISIDANLDPSTITNQIINKLERSP
jgi:dTMP kinase